VQASFITRWRNYPQTHRLQGFQCAKCSRIFFPKQYLCLCKSQTFSPFQLSGKGTVSTFTLVSNPPKAFEAESPYILALIKLEENVQMVAQLTDIHIEDVAIGMNVISVLRKIYTEGDGGTIQYGIKFKPM
jgi:uncharacterized protein